jgi:hypothetical protein
MQRSKVELLPEEIRQELEQRLIKGGFSGYVGLAEWLNSLGYEITKSSVHRYSKNKFEDRLWAMKIATDQAKAIAEASADDAGELNDAIIRLVQTKMFELLVDLEVDDKSLPRIGQAVAKLGQASVRQKQWQAEQEAAARKHALEDAVQAIDSAAAKESEAEKKMTPEELLKFIREQVYGLS